MSSVRELGFCDLLDEYLALRDLDRASEDSRPIAKRAIDRERAQEIRVELDHRVDKAKPG